MIMDVLDSFYNGVKGADSYHLDLDHSRRDPSAAGRERMNLISGYSRLSRESS